MKALTKNRFLTLETEFKKTHNNLYTYEFSIYYNSSTKLLITCKHHGEFEQQVSVHKNGHGCPKCAKEKTNYEKYKNKETILYYIKVNNLWKIGITLIDKRFKTLESNVLNKRFKGAKVDIEIIN